MISVTAGIIKRNGRYLIAQRRQDDTKGGYWEFPGGGVEPDETPDQCIVRELREELGVEARPLSLFDSITDRDLVVLFYRCEITGEPQPLDCAQLKWVLPQELTGYNFMPSDTEIVRRVAGE